MGWSRSAETLRDQQVADWATRCQQGVQARQCKRRATLVVVVEGNEPSQNTRTCWQHAPKVQDRRVAAVMNSRRVTVEKVDR